MKKPEKLQIMIVQADEDNLTLYSDCLSKRGYHVIGRYTKGNHIQKDVQKESPDVVLLNSKLPGDKMGTEVATEILDVYPSSPILFITADYSQRVEVKKHPKLRDKKIEILIKPVKLDQLENTILNLVNK
jgi:DNA-binding NtrC family response regulator